MVRSGVAGPGRPCPGSWWGRGGARGFGTDRLSGPGPPLPLCAATAAQRRGAAARAPLRVCGR